MAAGRVSMLEWNRTDVGENLPVDEVDAGNGISSLRRGTVPKAPRPAKEITAKAFRREK